MKKNYTAAWLLLGTLAATTAHAQDAARIQTKVLGDDNQPVLVEFTAAGKQAYKAADAPEVLRQQLALTTADQFRAVRSETDQIGFTHQRFAQYYQGIRVEHADYTVHAKAGAIESISGDFEKIAGLNTTPALTEATALSRALAHVGAQTYMWQTNEADAASFRPQGELVIVRDSRIDPATGPLVLAWKFNIYAAQPISRAYLYVDARTGEVVLTDNIIKHAAATGSFATAYSGTRNFTDGTTTGGYFLREGTTRGQGIETYNCRKGTSYTSAVDFIDANNIWTAAEYNNANFDNAAGDAHIGAQTTYDYWKNVHNRNSYDNAGAKIKSYVHYSNSYENAFWNGSVMTYGDGASRFRPLTSLDVCGHEIGHAVCSSTANLTYSYESGALNEGLSDIWGASIEAYAVGTLGFTSSGPKAKNTWLIGEEIDKQQAALRSMSDPKSQSQPAYYRGQYWYTGSGDNGGVHYNSGVLNHWYYILTVGKAGTNEGGVAYNVTGIGIEAAARITYRMESVYMTASTNYAQARTFAIRAATDLYGATSAQVTATTNAWNAVGVYAPVSCGTPGTLAATGISATGATLTWAAVSGATSYNVQYRASGATAWTTTTSTTNSKALTGLNPATTYQYQVQSVCSAGSGAYSSAASFTTSQPTYCASQGTNSTEEWIDYVSLGSITRTSGRDAGYYNGTALSTSLAVGVNQTITFSAGFAGTVYGENWKIYIDYNKNGVFTDAGEQVVTTTSTTGNNFSGSFTVPATARNGATRLRLVMSYANTATSCGTYSYGETEDYTVSIVGGTSFDDEDDDGSIMTLTGSNASSADSEAGRTLELYPNPATDVVRVVLPSHAEATTLLVTDMRGATVHVPFSDGTLNVSSLAKGVYMLTVNDGQKVFHQRLVKQ